MDFDKVLNNPHCQCNHTPSTKASMLKRYFDFLLHKNTLYFKYDDTSRCAKCGAPIRVPKAYYNPLLGLRYFLASMCGLLVAHQLLKIYAEGIGRCFVVVLSICVSVLLFGTCLTAVIFTFFPWHPCSEESTGIERLWEESRIQKNRRGAMFFSGVCFANFIIYSSPSYLIFGELAIVALSVLLDARSARTGDRGTS